MPDGAGSGAVPDEPPHANDHSAAQSASELGSIDGPVRRIRPA
jgi:hypothetical protein